MPILFDTDREAIARALASVPLPSLAAARIARITDTLSLTEMTISDALWQEVKARGDLTALGEPHELQFDAGGDLR